MIRRMRFSYILRTMQFELSMADDGVGRQGNVGYTNL
jgi:hypothetical protein